MAKMLAFGDTVTCPTKVYVLARLKQSQMLQGPDQNWIRLG